MVAVRMLRQLLRVGQADFAQLAGLSVRELVRIEKSEVAIKVDVSEKIDKAFYSVILDRAKEGADGKAG